MASVKIIIVGNKVLRALTLRTNPIDTAITQAAGIRGIHPNGCVSGEGPAIATGAAVLLAGDLIGAMLVSHSATIQNRRMRLGPYLLAPIAKIGWLRERRRMESFTNSDRAAI